MKLQRATVILWLLGTAVFWAVVGSVLAVGVWLIAGLAFGG